ncbi:hypothetical protein EDC04DRAFT_2605208 [Pisolithus marmoratus]|nr:hypothetical protein EDC04DRAFT_2605208 [Pisolithus marmoratus]
MPPHQTYQWSEQTLTKKPCKHCSKLYLPQGIKQHQKSSYMYHLLAKATTEAAAAPSLLPVHPGPGSLDSAVAIIPVPPTWFKCSTLYESFEEFGQQDPKHIMAPDSELWCPFASEGDYIFAMITVEAGLSSTQSSVTTNAITQFSEFKITAPYKGEDVMFPVYVCPLWDWALDLLQNPFLALHFVWDAQQLFKHDGKKYECFYTEPWMGDHWWDIQGYPMVVHCANLPIHICNGEQYGGGCIVGWLPIVPELVKEERKTGYANFKCVVWHKAFFKLLEKVGELSKVGYLHQCYDKVLQWLFPVILILSADYKELCVMTLIQGTKSKSHCPFCLVPLEKLWDLLKTYEMHTIQQHKEVLMIYEDKKSAGEKKLKSLGLCPIKNVFWTVEHSEPEQAASFEPLHSLHGGIGGKHMHGELKIVVSKLGCEFEMKLEEQVSTFPHWHGLAHFDTVIHITFSDGNKISPAGYWLLCMIHSYLQLDTLIGLDIHTEMTICMIKNELLLFRDKLKAYCSCVCHLDDTVKVIQAHIDAENEHTDLVGDGRNNEDDCEMFEGNTKLGAPQQPTSLSEVVTSHGDDKAFNGFCQELETFLNTCLPTYGYPLDKWIQLQGTHMIQEYQYLKVKYVSMVDWEVTMDHLRCSPNFHTLNETFQFALIQPLTARIRVHWIDQDFNLIQFKAISHAVSMFIPMKSIIQGGLLYPDPSHHGEFLVVEHINGNMFLQMKEWSQTHHRVAAMAEHLPSSDSDEMSTKTQSNGLAEE